MYPVHTCEVVIKKIITAFLNENFCEKLEI